MTGTSSRYGQKSEQLDDTGMRHGAISLALLVASALVLPACDQGTDIRIENATEIELNIFYDISPGARVASTLAPFESKEFTVIRDVWKGYLIAKDKSGSVVFQRQITWQELKKLAEIVIRRE